MNKTINIITFLIFAFLLLAGFIFGMVHMVKSDFIVPDGNNFCIEKGYDSVSRFGSYSEKYGKVKCAACYDLDCTYEEFNVTREFGIIKDAFVSKTEEVKK